MDNEDKEMIGHADGTEDAADSQTEEMKQRRKRAQKISFRILLVITIVVAGYIIYAIATKDVNIFVFQILLGAFVLSYMLLSDVLEPFLYGGFENLTDARRNGFIKMILMDLIGTGALLYWIVSMGSDNSVDFLIPVLIYFFTLQMKRKFRDEFDGVAKKKEPDEEDTEAAEESEALEDTEAAEESEETEELEALEDSGETEELETEKLEEDGEGFAEGQDGSV